ncbi:MAG: hypothetical protein ACKO5J_13230, partial [Rubrivivax sp.]
MPLTTPSSAVSALARILSPGGLPLPAFARGPAARGSGPRRWLLAAAALGLAIAVAEPARAQAAPAAAPAAARAPL